jgi:hypothetical protein
MAIAERVQAANSISSTPAMEARPADARSERSCDPFLTGDTDAACPKAKTRDLGPFTLARRSSAARREEEEAWAILVRVTAEATVRIGTMSFLKFVHARTLRGVTGPCLNNPGNYS